MRLKKTVAITMAVMAAGAITLSASYPLSASAMESSVSIEKSDTLAKKYIGKSKAKKIALKDARASKSKAKHLEATLDYEDDYGTYIYEVEFIYGEKEYSYDINAYTGKILDKDVESIYD